MFRELLVAACSKFGYEVIAAASTGADAVEAIVGMGPDVAILDLVLPDMDGFAVVEAARARGARTRILAVSSRCDEHTVYRIERAAFSGFLDKQAAAVDELRRAMEVVSSGGLYFSRAFLAIQKKEHANPHAFQKVLSRSQQVVLGMIGDLCDDHDVARRLGISHHTAEKHRFRIMHRLGLRSRDELLRYARRRGFTSLTADESGAVPGDYLPGGLNQLP
jgi:DNA-binding NarL/FixJ family response regulator